MRFIPGSAGFGTRRARGGFGGQVLEPCPGNPGNLEGCRCSSDLQVAQVNMGLTTPQTGVDHASRWGQHQARCPSRRAKPNKLLPPFPPPHVCILGAWGGDIWDVTYGHRRIDRGELPDTLELKCQPGSTLWSCRRIEPRGRRSRALASVAAVRRVRMVPGRVKCAIRPGEESR